jgi:hypothetical protein
MADPYLQLASSGQVDDISRLLYVRGKRFFNEHMTTALQRVHGHAVMGQVGGKYGHGIRSLLIEELAMIGERRHGRWPLGRPAAVRGPIGERLGRRQIRVGTADDIDRVQGQEPVKMNARRHAASGNCQPQCRPRHDIRRRSASWCQSNPQEREA